MQECRGLLFLIQNHLPLPQYPKQCRRELLSLQQQREEFEQQHHHLDQILTQNQELQESLQRAEAEVQSLQEWKKLVCLNLEFAISVASVFSGIIHS